MKHNYTIKRTLCALMLLTLSTLSWAYFEVDGIYYKFTSNQQAVMVTAVKGDFMNHFSGNCYSGDIVIPSTVTYENETYSVTEIEASAFADCPSLTSISIPESVKTIGAWAFGHTGLSTITLPKRLRTIEIGTFYECTSLTSVTLPKGLRNMGDNVFQGCTSLTDITILEMTAPSCSSFTFWDIDKETCTLHVPQRCAETYKQADEWKDFNNIVETWPYDFEVDGIYYHKTSDVAVEVTNVNMLEEDNSDKIVVPANVTHNDTTYSVTSIGEDAFLRCYSLTSVSLPDGIESIKESAFYYCTSLTTISLPKTLTSIGYTVFAYCDSLTDITCLTATPPICDSYAFLGGVDKEACTIHVPQGSADAYKQADVWKDFNNIIDDMPATAIATVNADTESVSTIYYTIDGKRVQSPTQKGIYIRDGKKVLVK